MSYEFNSEGLWEILYIFLPLDGMGIENPGQSQREFPVR